MTDITKTDNEKQSPSNEMMGMIERLAINPDVSPENIKSMLDIQERMMTKQAEIDFNSDMAHMQIELPRVIKANKGHNTTYASYEDIDKQVRPIMTRYGFSISFTAHQNNNMQNIDATLSHRKGHFKTASLTLPADGSGSKNAVQAIGSSISYGKRYLICMLLNIVTVGEDDDAQSCNIVISDEQSKKIKDLLKETNSDVNAFLRWMGVENVDVIKQSDYIKAENQLLAKFRKLKNENI